MAKTTIKKVKLDANANLRSILTVIRKTDQQEIMFEDLDDESLVKIVKDLNTKIQAGYTPHSYCFLILEAMRRKLTIRINKKKYYEFNAYKELWTEFYKKKENKDVLNDYCRIDRSQPEEVF